MPIITNIEDLRRLARRKVPKALFDYVDTGAYDEISYHANSTELKAIRFRQRILIDTGERKLATTMLGENVSMPVAIAQRRTLPGLGITPEPIEAIVPSYLWRFRKTGQFRTQPTQ